MTKPVRRSVSPLVAVTAFCLVAPAAADFHFWQILEIYSNVDGSIQYVELFTTTEFQNNLAGHQIAATSDDVERTFTFPEGVVGSTAFEHLLIATPGFALLPGAVTPDFTLPCGPFFDPTADSITIDFPLADAVTFSGSTLPIDGTNSLSDANVFGTANLVSGASSPRNFAGSGGAMALTGCLLTGACDACDDGFFCNGAEACSESACAAGAPPCVGMCVESAGECAAEEITLDVDADGSTDALTDGLLALRHAFSLAGAALVTGAVGAGCVRCDATAIATYLGGLDLALDADDTAAVGPLTDGLLVLRYLFGLGGATLTSGAVGGGCGRCDAAAIVPYLEGLDTPALPP